MGSMLQDYLIDRASPIENFIEAQIHFSKIFLDLMVKGVKRFWRVLRALKI